MLLALQVLIVYGTTRLAPRKQSIRSLGAYFISQGQRWRNLIAIGTSCIRNLSTISKWFNGGATFDHENGAQLHHHHHHPHFSLSTWLALSICIIQINWELHSLKPDCLEISNKKKRTSKEMKLSHFMLSTITAQNCDLSGYCASLNLFGCIVKRNVCFTLFLSKIINEPRNEQSNFG